MTRTHKKIITFLIITLALSSIYYAIIISAGTLEVAGGLLTLGLMWAPGIAAIITQLVFERTIRGLGWRPGRIGWLALAFALPLGYCLVVYGFAWITGLAGFPNPDLMTRISERWGGAIAAPGIQILLTMLLTTLFSMPFSMLSALGEEIGWRGLLVPELARLTTFPKVAILSGSIWALWHLPLLFFADYNNAGAPRSYAALMFVVMVLGISFAFAWLRLRSGSLWTAVILHAAHNLFVQGIFTPLTSPTALSPYILDEFGVGLALAGLVVAGLFLARRREVAQESPTPVASS